MENHIRDYSVKVVTSVFLAMVLLLQFKNIRINDLSKKN